jgi:Ca2+-binding EF-hand superfamily protein
VDTKKIRLSNEDLLDKKEQQVLALTYQVIIKFFKIEEEDDENLDLVEALTLWVKNKTQGYAGIKISKGRKFAKSFHDGKVFNALIHKMRPKLVDMDSLGDAKSNLTQALSLAETYLNIPQYVKPGDVANLDELSMIVYLSDWYFGVTLLQKQDIAARRVGKLVDLTKLHDGMRAEYTANATAIQGWVNNKIAELDALSFDDTLAGVRSRIEAFYAYKNEQRTAQVEAQLDASALFSNLATRLHGCNRPAWSAGAGLDPADLDQKFEELERSELKHSEKLHVELARQIRLHKLYKRYQAAGSKLETWVSENRGTVETKVEVNSVESAENALEELAIFVAQFENLKGHSFKDLNNLAKELVDERFEHAADIPTVVDRVNEAFASLDAAASAQNEVLTAAKAEQEKINEDLCQAFASIATEFNDWVKTKKATVTAPPSGELQEYLATLKSLQAEVDEANTKIESAEEAEAKFIARDIERNPYTNLTANDLKSIWKMYQLLLSKKVSLITEQIQDAERAGLTEEQVKEIDDNFAYFDSDSSGSLSVKELRTCLQSLGEESSKDVVAAIFENYSEEKGSQLTKPAFEAYMKARLGDTDTEAEIVRSFKHLSYDADVVTEVQLSTVVNNRSFNDGHVAYLLENMSGGDFATWASEVYQR